MEACRVLAVTSVTGMRAGALVSKVVCPEAGKAAFVLSDEFDPFLHFKLLKLLAVRQKVCVFLAVHAELCSRFGLSILSFRGSFDSLLLTLSFG